MKEVHSHNSHTRWICDVMLRARGLEKASPVAYVSYVIARLTCCPLEFWEAIKVLGKGFMSPGLVHRPQWTVICSSFGYSSVEEQSRHGLLVHSSQILAGNTISGPWLLNESLAQKAHCSPWASVLPPSCESASGSHSYLQDGASLRLAVHILAGLEHAQGDTVQQDDQHADMLEPGESSELRRMHLVSRGQRHGECQQKHGPIYTSKEPALLIQITKAAPKIC